MREERKRAEQYRRRAHELRRAAWDMHSAPARDTIWSLARNYELLADSMESFMGYQDLAERQRAEHAGRRGK